MAVSNLVPAYRYTIEKLLELRTSLPVVTCPVERVNKHADIASLFRIPDEAIKNPKRFSCQSKTLANITNRRIVSHGARRHWAETSEESEDRVSATMTSRRTSGQYQWNFRQRESSDRSSQPHSAPTEIAAQQSENFQRFYRAVVSPTHLRVTAGGRIVPNTRTTAPALPPPQLDWNSDKHQLDPKSYASRSIEPASMAAQAPPIYPNSPIAAGPFIPSPYNLVPHSSFAPMAPHLQFGTDTGNGAPGNELVLAAAAGGDADAASAQHIKISPPSQFDQTRPYMINGQVVFPVPPVNQAFNPTPTGLPMGPAMFGNPTFMPQPQFANNGGYLPPQFPGFLPGMANPFIFPGQQMPMMVPGLLAAEMMPPMFPYLPVRGMAPQPDVMRGQIQQLQHQVKFLEHQLANNRHQIDEHATEGQRAVFMSQIRSMELILELQAAQAAQEAAAARGQQHIDEVPVNSEHSIAPPVVYSTKHVDEDSTKPPTSVIQKSEQCMPTTTSEEQPEAPVESPITHTEPVVKSKLSIKAPAFQPRSRNVSHALAIVPPNQSNSATYGNKAQGMGHGGRETQEQIENRLTSRATGKYGSFNSSAVPIRSTTLPKATNYDNASYNHAIHNNASSPVSPQRAGDYGSVGKKDPGMMVPYLIGSLPHGINAHLAKSSDFSYSRPLNEEEVRARHLYWGKAPHSIQRGLPKFDGKDFYPPSPVKQNARMATSHSSMDSSVQHEERDYVAAGFANLFTEPGAPGYKQASPARSMYASPTVSSVPHHVYSFASNDHALGKSQKSSFSDSRNDVKSYGMMSFGSPANSAANNVGLDDFSNLFNEPGVPGYKSPTGAASKNDQKFVSPRKLDGETPATPTKSRFSKETTGRHVETARNSLHQTQDENRQRINSEPDTVVSCQSTQEGARSSRSSVDSRQSPEKILSPRSAHEKAFVQRVENFRNSEVQHVFLQNMLKNVSQSGPVLSGSITPTIAQGFLPQYRGSAAASLTPTMMNNTVADRDLSYSQSGSESVNDMGKATVAFMHTDVLAENRPPQMSRRSYQVTGGSEDSGAQEYMRHIAQKDDKNKKMIDQSAEQSPAPLSQRSGW